MKIDREFAAVFDPLTEEETRLLEDSIKREGCRDPLVIWKEEGLLLDGHNRHRVCQANGVKFATRELSFPNRGEAKRWMWQNQLGRRNLTKQSFRLIIADYFEAIAKPAHDGGKGKPRSEPQNEATLKTSEVVAQKFGVSKATVERAVETKRGLDLVAQHDPKVRERYRAGEIDKPLERQIQRIGKKAEANPKVAEEIGKKLMAPPEPPREKTDLETLLQRNANRPYPWSKEDKLIDICQAADVVATLTDEQLLGYITKSPMGKALMIEDRLGKAIQQITNIQKRLKELHERTT